MGTATNLVITDELPSGFNYNGQFTSTPISGPDSAECFPAPLAPGVVTCEISSLEADKETTVKIFVEATEVGKFTNTALLTADLLPAPVVSETVTTRVVPECECSDFTNLPLGTLPSPFVNGSVRYDLLRTIRTTSVNGSPVIIALPVTELTVTDAHPVRNPDGVHELKVGLGVSVTLPRPAGWLRLSYIRRNTFPLHMRRFEEAGQPMLVWSSPEEEPQGVRTWHDILIPEPPIREFHLTTGDLTGGALPTAGTLYLFQLCYAATRPQNPCISPTP